MADQPTHSWGILYMLAVVVLIIATFFVASAYLDNLQLRSTYFTYNLGYSIKAARVLNSPECFAWEENYFAKDGSTQMRVVPAAIDLQKFQKGITSACIDDRIVYAHLTIFDENGPVSEYEAGAIPDDTWKTHKYKYFVNVKDGSNEHTGLMEFQLKSDE